MKIKEKIASLDFLNKQVEQLNQWPITFTDEIFELKQMVIDLEAIIKNEIKKMIKEEINRNMDIL